jgi:8-oxo-dGTP diphosphatase
MASPALSNSAIAAAISSQLDKKAPRVGVGVLVVKEGKLLLGQRKGSHGAGTWSPPGGHVEFGETIEDCAKRELKEETGLNALSVKLGPWTQDFMEGGQKHYLTLFVFVDEFSGEPALLEPDKCEGWKWFSWDHLPSPLFASVKSLIEKFGLEKIKGNSAHLHM